MSTLLGIDFLLRIYYPHLHAWLEGALQTSIIVAVAGLMVMIFFRRSACARSWMWRASFIGLLAAGVWACAPTALWEMRPAIKPRPQDANLNLAHQITQVVGLLDDNKNAYQAAQGRMAKEWITDAPTDKPPWQRPEHASADLRYARPEIPGFMESGVVWLWWGGAALLAAWKGLRVLLGWRWLRRQSLPATSDQEAMTGRVAEEMGVRRPIQCRQVSGIASPVLTGGRRPIVWLPRESVDWSSAELRWVLRHELAHWKRRDGLWQGFARMTTCFWWWTPLAWLALRHLEADAEMAADEMAVGQDAGSPDYAELLVNLTQASAPRCQPLIGVAMLGRSLMADRVRAIITFHPQRGHLGRWAAATAVMFGLVGIAVSAMTVGGPPGLVPAAAFGKTTPLSPTQRQLARQTLQALQHRHEQLRILHFKLEQTVSRLDDHQTRITSKSTAKLEGWSDQWTGQYRAEFRPNVMIWTRGAAPFSVGNETSIETGRQRYYSWNNGKLLKTASRLDEFAPYLGLSTEYRVMRLLTAMLRDNAAGRGPWMFDIREVPWHDGKALELTQSFLPPVPNPSPQVTTYWLDPTLGCALVRCEEHSSASYPGPVWALEESATTSSGLAYPKRFSYTEYQAEKAQYHTSVTLLETLDRLPDGVLEVRESAK